MCRGNGGATIRQPTPPLGDGRSWLQTLPVLLGCGAALILGLYARFKGLGTWPLAVDEYYIARSIEFILQSGLPEYPCGGFYARGLTLQYAGALLQIAGLSPELAPRLIAAISSLIALPAVYLIARRAHSRPVAVLAVTVLLLSVWEVEIARFGRMYAPFQAIFAWYLVFFLRYTLDRDNNALWAMILLTIVGVLTWEGGALLALVNLLPPFLNHSSGRLGARDWIYLAGTGALLLIVLRFDPSAWRFAGEDPPWPDGYGKEAVESGDAEYEGPLPPWATLLEHPLWSVLALVPAAAAFLATKWALTFRSRWLTAVGIVVALVAALLHQFLLAGAAILLLVMLRLLGWRELFSRAAFPFHAAVILSLVFWTAYGLLTDEWRSSEDIPWLRESRVLALAYEFLRFPAVLIEIARPWAQAVPILSLVLAGLIALAIIQSIARDPSVLSAERVLQMVLVCMLLAVGMATPPRHETRYVFFLYPVAIVVSITAVARLIESRSKSRHVTLGVAGALALGGFTLTEDFSLRHLLRIDAPEVNFRLGTPGRLESHVAPRSDVRGAATWLAQHANAGKDLLINAFPSVDFYFREFDFTYIDQTHQRFSAYACRRGTVERWGNLPLLYTLDALEAEIDKANRAFLVVDRRMLDELLPGLGPRQPRMAWTSIDGQVHVIAFGRT